MDLEGQSRLISNSAGPECTVLHGPPGLRKAWVGGSNPFVGSVNSAKPILTFRCQKAQLGLARRRQMTFETHARQSDCARETCCAAHFAILKTPTSPASEDGG